MSATSRADAEEDSEDEEERGGRGRRGRRRRSRRGGGDRRRATSRRRRDRRRRRAPRGQGAARRGGSLARRDPMAAYMRETRRYPLLTPEEEHALAVRLVEHGDTARGAQADRGEPAAGREDRLRVPPRAQEPARPRAGGQHRPHPGGHEVRPVPRRQAVELRGVLDPRLHPEVHPQQLAAGEDRHHAGAAQAVLQPAQGAREARAARLPADHRAARRAARRPREGGHRDGAPARRARGLARRAARQRRRRRRTRTRLDYLPSDDDPPRSRGRAERVLRSSCAASSRRSRRRSRAASRRSSASAG